MNPIRKRRLILILVLIGGVGLAVALAGYALQSNINLFYPPTEIANGNAPLDRVIRVGGLVVDGSVERDQDSLAVRFEVTDNEASVAITYNGILPDLFREGQGIIARGKLSADGVLQASEVLAKHDENYMPPEIAATLQSKGMPHGADPAGSTAQRVD